MADFEEIVRLKFEGDERQLKRALSNIDKSVKATAQRMSQLEKEQRGVTREFEVFGQIGGALPGQLGPAAGAVGALTGAFKNARGSLLAFGLVAGGIIGGIIKFSDEIGGLVKQVFTANEAFGLFREELAEVRKEQAKTVDASRKLIDSLFPEEAQERLFAANRELLEKGRRDSKAVAKFLKDQQVLVASLSGTNSTEFLNARDAAEKAFRDRVAEIDRSFDRAELAITSKADELRHRQRERAAGPGGQAATPGGGGPFFDRGRVRESGAVTIPGGGSFTDTLGRSVPGAGLGGALGAGGQFAGGALGVGVPSLPQTQGGRVLTQDEIERAQELQATVNAAMESFAVVTAAAQGSFDAWVSGSVSAMQALSDFFSGALQGIASHMFAKSLEHGAFAIGALATGNAPGAALHGKAAAAFGAGAIAVGALARQFGGGSGTGGGGALGGAAAGGLSAGGGGGRSEQIFVVEVPFEDSPRRRRKQIHDAITRSRREQGGGSVVVRS